MIIYNETVIIEEASHLNWLSWMKEVQIPAIMATGLFTHHRILTVMDSPNEGVTYCVQYEAADLSHVETFFSLYLEGFANKQQRLFENKLVNFSSLMQSV